jgi:hypothetical protein
MAGKPINKIRIEKKARRKDPDPPESRSILQKLEQLLAQNEGLSSAEVNFRPAKSSKVSYHLALLGQRKLI